MLEYAGQSPPPSGPGDPPDLTTHERGSAIEACLAAVAWAAECQALCRTQAAAGMTSQAP